MQFFCARILGLQIPEQNQNVFPIAIFGKKRHFLETGL